MLDKLSWLVIATTLLVLVDGCAEMDEYSGTVPTAQQTVGTCHQMSTPEELVTASDIAPPVSCMQPHQTETIFVGRFSGLIATQANRPVVEQLEAPAHTVCRSAGLPQFLGAGPRDSFLVDVWPKIPTRAEWASGVRIVRCDAVPNATNVPAGPTISVGMRGIMRTPASAQVRACWRGSERLPCGQPHTAEEVNAWISVVGVASDPTAYHIAQEECAPYVVEFLGAPLSSFPNLVVKPIFGTGPGPTTVKCAVGDLENSATVGTLAKDARS